MLSDALALLVIGVPLWLKYWQKIQLETSLSDEIGVAAANLCCAKLICIWCCSPPLWAAC